MSARSDPAPARPGPKPTLTRAMVIEAALDLIDTDGLGALNLRKLAGALGVSPMTPYSYFEDKSDLLGAMVGYALEPLAIDAASSAPWDEQLEAAMRGLHDALERHPGVIELVLSEADSDRLNEFRQAIVQMLTRGGLTRRQSTDALRTLTSYILGYTMLTRLRGRARRRSRSPESFDHGLVALMDAVRGEAGVKPAVAAPPRAPAPRRRGA